MKSPNFFPLLALLAGLVVVLPPAGRAADVFWTNTTVGDFLNALNWSPNAVPGAADNVRFQGNFLPLISWSASRTNANAFVNNTNGGFYQLISNSFWLLTNSYIVGQNAGSTAYVFHSSGELRVTNAAGTAQMVIGENGNGSYLLQGTNTSVVTDHLIVTNVTASATNSLFNFSSGSLTINEGSIIRTGGNDFRIGSVTNRTATLNILGGTNMVDTGAVGETILGFTNNLRSLVTVSGAGTLWSNSGFLVVGSLSGGNQLTITGGARATNRLGLIGNATAGDSNLVLVTGAGSAWNNSEGIEVGTAGSQNRLVVSNGATVRSAVINVGFSPSAVGNEVVVTGSGSLLTNSDTVWIGVNGDANRLLVTNNGAVVTANALMVGLNSSSAANRLIVDGGTLRVSNAAATATLDIRRGTNVLNAGLIDAQRLLVTNAAGVFDFNAGTLTLRDGSTIVRSNQDFLIGTRSNQTATLNLLGGTNVFNTGTGGNTILGGSNGLRSLVTVSGTGTLWSNSGTLVVGDVGSGNQLTISGGAQVTNLITQIGRTTTSDSNLVLVAGPGSIWNHSSFGGFQIGLSGSANRLVVSNGATVATGGVNTIGFNSSSASNEVLVTGSGSLWSNVGLLIGYLGSANRLIISNNGTVRVGGLNVVSGGNLIVGDSTNSAANRLIVDGGTLLVSNGSSVASLDIRRGTNVLNAGLMDVERLLVTNAAGAFDFNAGTLTIRNGSTLLRSNQDFLIGTRSNQTATLNLLGGSNQFDLGFGSTVLGGFPNVTSVVNVSGAGTFWSNDTLVVVGELSGGNRLTVSGGATATAFASGFRIGVSNSSDGNLMLLTDPGTQWRGGSSINVGLAGSGNRLVVSNGAALIVANGFVGASPESTNNEVLVTGAGSVWTNTISAAFANQGSGNRVIARDGGVIYSPGGTIGSATTATNNLFLITDPDSAWFSLNGEVRLGSSGVSNRLVISNGGALYSRDATIGDTTNSRASFALITGGGSLWTNQRSIVVGNSGRASLLIVSNGGLVTTSNLFVGSNAPSTNNRVIVDGGTLRATSPGTNGMLETRRGTNVLNAGVIEADRLLLTNALGKFEFNGGTLITRGTFISNGAPFVIGRAGTTPAVWDVRDSASNHLVFGDLYLGDTGRSNVLAITNGATLAVHGGATYVGVAAASDGNRAIVSGAGSVWSNTAGSIYLGFDGDRNELLVSGGGVVRSLAAAIGVNLGASNVMTVTGTNSAWLLSQDLQIGSFSPGNQLVVSNGGVVRNGNASIGSVSFSSNNLALVTGAGSLWSNQSLIVGFEGGGNRVIVTNNGILIVNNLLTIGAEASSLGNRVVVDGGLVRVTNVGGTATLDVRRGTNELYGGLLVADALLLTNPLGHFVFSGGALHAGNLTNNNGRAFVVGDGASPAELRLLGGVHSFSNNLVIASNATLSGSGIVRGTVTNFGTVGPGASAGDLFIRGDLRLRDSASVAFELGGLLAGVEHDRLTVTNFVEFAGTLSLSLLPGFLPENDDTFTLLSFTTSSGAFANAPIGGRVSLTNNLASFAVNYSFTNVVIGDIEYVDSDGDGQPDLFEQASGTDAAEPTDLLMITSLTVDGLGRYVVQFQSVASKSYRVEYTDDFVTWNPATGAIITEPAPGVGQWVDDGSLTGGLAVNQRSYRVGLQ